MSELSGAKKLLRKTLLARRKLFTTSLSSDSIRSLNDRVSTNLLRFLLANNIQQGAYIAGFIPIRYEIDIQTILFPFQKSFKFCLPVHQRSEFLQPLIFREYQISQGKDQLILGEYGIPVPSETATHVTPTIILTPFLGFDALSLHRIGYGGGHFDRTIQQYRALSLSESGIKQKFIGVGFDCQREEQIPNDEGDQPLDAIITEECIYTLNKAQ